MAAVAAGAGAATSLRATDRRPDHHADVLLLRYLDVCLVLATAPFVALGGLPTLGYVLGAGAWILTRAGTAVMHARARRASDMRLRAGLMVASLLGRVWLVALAVIVARYAGGRDDGIMAAAIALAAFTVYLAMSFVTREGPLSAAGATRRPTTS